MKGRSPQHSTGIEPGKDLKVMRDKMRLLIGYDGSECADAALDDLQCAGLPQHAEAKVFSVAEEWLPPPPPSAYEIVEQAQAVHVPADLNRVYGKESPAVGKALALAERAVTRLSSIFPEWQVTPEAKCGSPASELLFAAEEWRPDLIVVGSHGRTALGRFILGSVSQRVLTEAHCSVRVARGRLEEPGTPVRIIVGVDGSAPSEAAAREVAARSWAPGSEVQLIVVDDPLSPGVMGRLIPSLHKTVDETNAADRIWAKEILAKCSKLFLVDGVRVATKLREGDPRHELVKAAEAWRADCIFVGSTGYSGRLERLVLGSVSAAISARAHCSVEVIR